MADYTPGPWKVSKSHPSVIQGGPLIQFARGQARVQVAMACGPCESDDAIGEQLANARLIAAAPDLLAALKEYHARWHVRARLHRRRLHPSARTRATGSGSHTRCTSDGVVLMTQKVRIVSNRLGRAWAESLPVASQDGAKETTGRNPDGNPSGTDRAFTGHPDAKEREER